MLRDDRVLLAARGRAPLRDIFSLPGGVVETGETLAEAAIRELMEETTVRAAIIGFIAPIEFLERDEEGRTRHHYVICAHAARWLSGEPRTGDEVSSIRWLAEDEIGTVPTTPGLDPVLRAAFALGRSASGRAR